MRALHLVAALSLAQALQFTTQQAKTPALLDAATTLKASARPLTKVLLDAAEGASDEARAETMKTLRDMLCSPSATQLVACRGAEDSTDVIATCAVAAREPSGSALPRRAHISDLYVEESCRRAGVATALVEDALALARARGLECVTLEVETDNAGARRLYEKLGFRGESLRSPLAFFKYGTWAWNKDILRLDMAAGD
jgi:ribosomal protein S18 acetylase RimI-like enzyme